ncbi:MAG TPA: hypothetical protein IAA83_05490 [Candidatus Avoscillospira avistercoris]|uniref:Uncharacterized protein n=1 Tax=Candidatus Avoscillospira avistercoris TaxID=2840707 RepID=A0A9D1JU26_9FIRM|nr:hypothetical protein [Candidatus Avoscillospira avistercoris]
MERLTTRLLKGDGYYMKCSQTCLNDCQDICECEGFDRTINKLGEIEDILGDDYDLDRLRELVQADREGRCVKKIDNRNIYMDRDCQHFTPATNADRIRSMTDEELVQHIWNKFGCPDGKNHVTCGCLGSCKDCWLDWLKQPAKDE